MNLKIGPMIYTVTEVEGLFNESGDKLSGHHIIDQLTIRVEKNLPEAVKRVTLLHEVIHALMGQAGHVVTDGQIDALSYGLYKFLSDNPDFLK